MNLKLRDDSALFADKTGIYVRAQDKHGGWSAYDIAQLDASSLLTWLRSRGGDNHWAENTVGVLLGHEHLPRKLGPAKGKP